MSTHTHTNIGVGFGAVIVVLVVGTAAVVPAVFAGVSTATATAFRSDKPSKQTAIHIVAFEPWDEGGPPKLTTASQASVPATSSSSTTDSLTP
ncbi:MAG TPA: hypothetical protein VGV93_05365 [Acidimicrobiales bacterium]|nr:hypothetical protein [Acidimicrobiales bacterium]